MGSLFIVVPALWFTAMGWAGINLGNIAQALTNGSKSSQTAGEKGFGASKKAFEAVNKE